MANIAEKTSLLGKEGVKNPKLSENLTFLISCLFLSHSLLFPDTGSDISQAGLDLGM